MLQNDSNKKKNSVMKNIQKLRNEIEEIRVQNLALIENLKPYEKWYDETKEMLFSSYKTRRRLEMSRSNSNSHYFSVSSSSSLSSESSDTEVKSQAFENQKNSDDENDEFFSDDEYIQKKGPATVNKKPTSNKPQTPTPQSPVLPNQISLNSIKILNQNGNRTSNPFINPISLQTSSPVLNSRLQNLNINLLNLFLSQNRIAIQRNLPVYNTSQNFNQFTLNSTSSPVLPKSTIQNNVSPQKKVAVDEPNTQEQLISEQPNTTNSNKNQFDLLIDPPPIFPGIDISYQKVSDSDEDKEQKEQSDDKSKEQIVYKSILTPIVKINLT